VSVGIVWFRQDLRVADNPALSAACAACDSVVCLFIDDPEPQTLSQLGSASRVWLHHSLAALSKQLAQRGARLDYAKGHSEVVLLAASKHYNATRLFWNRCYDPKTIKRDKKIKQSLSELQPESFNALLNAEPWDALKGDGTPYRVYTPYWRRRTATLFGEKPLGAPRNIPGYKSGSKKTATFKPVGLDKLALLPERDWHVQMMSHWQVGEIAAMTALKRFAKAAVHDYDDARNLPAIKGTSKLSPHLHFGEISPRQVMQLLSKGENNLHRLSGGEQTFAKEIIWREFAYSLLYHFPHTIKKPLDKRFENFPWQTRSKKHLNAWQQGMTGVPIVDAGMRELYATGWMHNRVRMIVASYLVKNLLIPWQKGEQWFRETLVDADLASNVMGWQWAAGSGADAAPYFRVFNPVLQGEKFDKSGDYVRRWVPEIEQVPNQFIHKPWELPALERRMFAYPEPLVDLKQSRERALAAFETIKTPV